MEAAVPDALLDTKLQADRGHCVDEPGSQNMDSLPQVRISSSNRRSTRTPPEHSFYPKMKKFATSRRHGAEVQVAIKPQLASSSSKQRKRRRPTTASKPSIIPLVEDGSKIIGLGRDGISAHKVVHQRDSAAYLRKPIKKVDSSSDYFKTAKASEKEYRLFKDSTIIESKDGVPLVLFVKKGMFAGLLPELAKSRAEKSLRAIDELIVSCPPKLPRDNDPRHQVLRDDERQRCAAEDLKRGLYHFAYWRMKSHAYAEPMISKDARPDSDSEMQSVVKYLEETAWEHGQISSWLESLDHPIWQEYHNSYQGLRSQLGHLYQGTDGCQSSLALLVNMAVGPHKDPGDVKDGWVATCCWGEFEGAHAVFPDLACKFKQEPGDLLLARPAVLEHWITPITKGNRTCHVRFTKANVLRPDEIRFECPITPCSRGYKADSSLLRHLKNDHSMGAEDAVKRAKQVVPRNKIDEAIG